MEEFLDYNEDEANLNLSPEVIDIEEIIDDLKSVDNEEEDLYSPPPIPLHKHAQVGRTGEEARRDPGGLC